MKPEKIDLQYLQQIVGLWLQEVERLEADGKLEPTVELMFLKALLKEQNGSEAEQ